MTTLRHFLDLSAVSGSDLREILDHAHERKVATKDGTADRPLDGKILAMIFEKPSTRTRVSFDVGMRQLGGETILLSGREMQLGRAESIADTARVLSRYVDAVMIRTTDHQRLTELAEHATVPVINGLTDDTPSVPDHGRCHDVRTASRIDCRQDAVMGRRRKQRPALSHRGFCALRLPHERQRAQGLGAGTGLHRMGSKKWRTGSMLTDPEEAVSGTDCVITDTWVSMGQEQRARGHNIFKPYQVNRQLMEKAGSNALFMHCLPAHRGEEVTDEVIDGPQSVVFDEAENRLHAQKAILAWCLGRL